MTRRQRDFVQEWVRRHRYAVVYFSVAFLSWAIALGVTK
jgi:hypothetical protein